MCCISVFTVSCRSIEVEWYTACSDADQYRFTRDICEIAVADQTPMDLVSEAPPADTQEDNVLDTTVCTSGNCEPIVQIGHGWFHTCALTASHRLYCWGENNFGQLGDGTTASRTTPQLLTGTAEFVEIATTSAGVCARTMVGTVSCWGVGPLGMRGVSTCGSVMCNQRPVEVPNLTGVVMLAGGFGHMCAVLSNRSVMCWGDNDVGQVGDGTVSPTRELPTTVPGVANVRQMACGAKHSCVLLDNGSVRCWGGNMAGQTGQASSNLTATPTLVPGINFVEELALGYSHSCVRRNDRTVACWGDNQYGQLGDNTTTSRSTPQMTVPLPAVRQVRAGAFHTCALLDDNTVQCWGDNQFGQLGDSTQTPRMTPTVVTSLPAISELGGGGTSYTVCAALNPTGLSCWGLNMNNQVGDGTNQNRLVPTQVLP